MFNSKEKELKSAVLKHLMDKMDVNPEVPMMGEGKEPKKAMIIEKKMIVAPKESEDEMEDESPELEKGEEIEAEEHPELGEDVAEQIAADHLKEDPKAYSDEEGEEEEDDEEALLSPRMAKLFGKNKNRGY